MIKQDAVASLGEQRLLRPARLREALKANDRLKLVLTLLQAGATHAQVPQEPVPDLAREIGATDIDRWEDPAWLRNLPGAFTLGTAGLHLPELPRLMARLRADLQAMAAPLLEDDAAGLAGRVTSWSARLDGLAVPYLALADLAALVHGRRADGDSLHLLVMDLHRALNGLAAELSTRLVDGAHVWQLAPDGADEPRVAAFMRGLARTAPLKLDHPGLETSATRDGARLLIQNDIGTNDAHVLVVQVEQARITVTYSDLHRQRFAFFQDLLAEAGAKWTKSESRTTPGLNEGAAYTLGTATFEVADEQALCERLEALAARIVFVIDWNRARKRLVPLVGKASAVAVLREAARREVGHMAWLKAGGDRLVWNAMSGQADADFRLGDRLDDVLPEAAARDYLVQVLALAWDAAQRRLPDAYVADEARLLLTRSLAGRHMGFGLLQEHAALCHALAAGLLEALEQGWETDTAAVARLALRAKAWERSADELVERARAHAERQPRWQAFTRLLEGADDIADALEEAAFVLSVIGEGHHKGWTDELRQLLRALAGAVMGAVEDHVRAVAVASGLGEGSDAADHGDYLDALWRVLQAERRGDELHRQLRRVAAGALQDAPSLALCNELAQALESASDGLLAFGFRLRDHAFRSLVGTR